MVIRGGPRVKEFGKRSRLEIWEWRRVRPKGGGKVWEGKLRTSSSEKNRSPGKLSQPGTI